MAITTTKFNILDYLKTAEEQAEYLRAAIDEDDPNFIAVAIGDIAKARGVSQFASETGLSRETIYKSFRPGGNPTIETVNKALKVLGLKLSLEPVKGA
jgi:probable addiction module antidote protein